MIDFLKIIALRDKFVCDRCGSPDLLLGMYDECFVCKNSLVRKAIKSEDRLRLYSLDIFLKFVQDFDQFISESNRRTIIEFKKIDCSLAAQQAKTIFEDCGRIGGEKIGGVLKFENGRILLSLNESYSGDNYERTIVFLAVSGALKHICEIGPSRDLFKTYPDKLMNWVIHGDDPKYLKRQRLTLYVQELCEALNKNSFYQETWVGNRLIRSEYEVNEDYPEETFLGQITENLQGYEFLKMNNLIQNDICHFCGDFLTSARYTFTEPVNRITFPICKACYTKVNI